MKRIASIAIVLGLAACGGAQKDVEQQPASTAVFGLGEASLSGEKDGTVHEIKLTADGKLWADGKHVMTVTAAGEIMDPAGVVKATMSADGKLTSVPPKPNVDDDMTIRDDGAIVDDKGQVAVEFGADGYLTGPLIAGEGGGVKIKFTGAPETRRALALAFMLVASEPQPMPAEGATVEPAPVPAPTPTP